MHVYMNVCMYVCLYNSIYVCLYVHTYIHTLHICKYVCMYKRLCMQLCILHVDSCSNRMSQEDVQHCVTVCVWIQREKSSGNLENSKNIETELLVTTARTHVNRKNTGQLKEHRSTQEHWSTTRTQINRKDTGQQKEHRSTKRA